MNIPEELKEKIKQLPDAPGVYLMKNDKGVVLYIGKAKSLRKRVMSYFTPSSSDTRLNIRKMMPEVSDIDFVQAASDIEALLMEARLIKDTHPPYNREMRDGKLFPYLEITMGDDFPAVYVTRRAENKKSKYFGPFTNVTELRRAVPLMQKAFKFRTCSLEINANDKKRRFNRPCLLHHIDRCLAPCSDRISRDDYREQIRLLIRFLEGKRTRVIGALKKQMKECAEKLDFETAAMLRDEISAIESLSQTGDSVSFPEAFAAPVANMQQGMLDLQKKLKLNFTPRRIDGIDAANIRGRDAVASVVVFVDGKPFKEGYRRYRIKTAPTDDDYAMIREVISRRFKRLIEEDEQLPDILLIDGGAGHLASAIQEFKNIDISPPVLISLAKKEETAYIGGLDFEPTAIPRMGRTSDALKVLQRVRDEAHRFAQHYHHMLRSREFSDIDILAKNKNRVGKKKRKSSS